MLLPALHRDSAVPDKNYPADMWAADKVSADMQAALWELADMQAADRELAGMQASNCKSGKYS